MSNYVSIVVYYWVIRRNSELDAQYLFYLTIKTGLKRFYRRNQIKLGILGVIMLFSLQ